MLKTPHSALMTGLASRSLVTSKHKDLRITASDGSVVFDKALLVAASMAFRAGGKMSHVERKGFSTKLFKRLLRASDHILLPDFTVSDVDKLARLLYCGQVCTSISYSFYDGASAFSSGQS